MLVRIIFIIKHVKYWFIALIVSLLLITTWSKNTTSGYYNKIIHYKYKNILSPNSISLIITTVSGDKNYLENNLSIIYRELNITHLLVLSGSNLVIFRQFFSLFIKRNNKYHFVITLLAITTYFCYVNYLHPVARAVLFSFINEYLTSFGLKYDQYRIFLILFLLSLFFYFNLYKSNSFLLSLIFSLATYYYSINKLDKLSSFSFVKKFLLFPLYMTVVTVPISYIFFGHFNFVRSLVSNTLIVPLYDYLVLYLYLLYIASFTPIVPRVAELVSINAPIENVLLLFKLLLSVFELYNI